MDKPFQLSLFEPSMTKTVELTEIDGQQPNGILRYLDMATHKNSEIKTCPGDIYVICNALEDYANILERVIAEWDLTGYHAACYEIHAARCRKISQKYADAIGYDYQKAIERCAKTKKNETQGGVGEDALVLAVNRK